MLAAWLGLSSALRLARQRERAMGLPLAASLVQLSGWMTEMPTELATALLLG